MRFIPNLRFLAHIFVFWDKKHLFSVFIRKLKQIQGRTYVIYTSYTTSSLCPRVIFIIYFCICITKAYFISYPPIALYTHYVYGFTMPKKRIDITIREDQKEYLEKNHIKLSPFVREWIDQHLMS